MMKLGIVFLNLILLIMEVRGFCYSDEHCPDGFCNFNSLENENVKCQYGVCTCPEGQFYQNYTCVPGKKNL